MAAAGGLALRQLRGVQPLHRHRSVHKRLGTINVSGSPVCEAPHLGDKFILTTTTKGVLSNVDPSCSLLAANVMCSFLGRLEFLDSAIPT